MTATGQLPPLPLEAVRNLEARDVAEWLELPKARERGKYGCVWCDSSDAMEAYRGPGRGFYCFSCTRGGSTIDATMAKLGLGLPEAVKALASRFGVLSPQAPTMARALRQRPAAGRTPVQGVSGHPPGQPAINPGGDGEAPAGVRPLNSDENTARVYGATIEALTLTERGLAYLASRGLGYPETARADGFRSVDGLQGWKALKAALLERGLTLAQIRDAITPRREHPRPGEPERHPLPWAGRAAVLVIPYRWRGQVLALRFRKLEPRDKGDRYRDLGGSRSPVPFNADALDDVAGRDLHVCEGELDAWALTGCDGRLRVIGIPGVGQLPGGPGAPWLRLAGQARRVLCWHDPDKPNPRTGKSAGAEGAARLKAALREANRWSVATADRMVKRVRVPGVEGKVDVCDFWQRGKLSELLATLPEDL